ncbi:MAG: phosphatase PAP2 family protein [Bacteroidetes bacterium]|nr:phosphatase PAP2 family protein [Bacteroidota bacterium]
MIESIKKLDLFLFKFIHVRMSNEVFDAIMPFLRIPYFWAPVYLFLLIWMWKNDRRAGLIWCLFFFLTFVFCDSISAHFIKNWVQRIRPCNDESLAYIIHKLVACGRGYSFPSTHATNHFGMSFFMIFTIAHKYKYLSLLAIAWAGIICFAQIYVGVHYPFDIIAGMLLGLGIAKGMALYFHTKVTLN